MNSNFYSLNNFQMSVKYSFIHYSYFLKEDFLKYFFSFLTSFFLINLVELVKNLVLELCYWKHHCL